MPTEERPLKVLVADDDPDILDLISYRLERSGWEVIRAVDGEEALFMVSTEKPDLAVLDLMMPKLDGYEVIRRLRSDPSTKDLPVIILTASAQEADIVKGFEAGADDYMTKPFSPQELRHRMQAIVARRS